MKSVIAEFTNGPVRIWDARSGVQQVVGESGLGSARAIGIGTNGQALLVAENLFDVFRWDMNLQKNCGLAYRSARKVAAVEVSPNGRYGIVIEGELAESADGHPKPIIPFGP
ncbi:MAG: hypothetical protein L0Z50_03935 [Verrucomicrobiales bacterium]|nr:hypothetical protein [Verrucomicrobiales bacterium]